MKRLFLLLLTILLLFSLFFKRNSLLEIPIKFSSDNFPIVPVSIDKSKYLFELTLSNPYPLYINKIESSNFKQVSEEKAVWKNIKGESCHSSLYRIPHVNLGTFSLKNCLATTKEMENPDVAGEICWPFDKVNLLMDFPHHRIYGISTKKDLDILGVDTSRMEKVKCQITNKGVYFKVHSTSRKYNATLMTTADQNFISDSLQKNRDPFYTNITFNGKNFGHHEFLPLELPIELEMEMILGMEFLKDHVVYIDAKNSYVYFGDKFSTNLPRKSLHKIPLKYTTYGTPVAFLKIGGKRVGVEIDLGFDSELALPPNVLEPKNLEYLTTKVYYNGLGEKIPYEVYILPKCTLEDIEWKNTTVYFTDKFGVSTGVISKAIGEIDSDGLGLLGIPILHRSNLYFDFPNACMWVAKTPKDLNMLDVNLDEFERIPFVLNKSLISFTIQCDLGPLCFALDTGAVNTIVKEELMNKEDLKKDENGNICLKTREFIIGNQDFGKMKLYPLFIAPEVGEIDGILGMDFLKDYAIYIDYLNRELYLQRPKKSSLHFDPL